MPIATPPRSTSIKPPSSIRQSSPGVGDFDVMPTNLGVYAPEHWCDNALCRPWALVAAYLCLGSTGEQYFFARTFEPKENWLLQLKSFTAMTGYQNQTPYVSEMTNLV